MKILFISANRIGDAVLTTGILAWIHETCPQAHFTIACGPVTRDLFRAVPNVDCIIDLKKQKRHGHWVDLWKQCIGTRWDIIVDLRNSIVSRLLFANKKYTKPARATGRHKVIDLGGIFGLNPPPDPKLFIDQAAQDIADRLVHHAGPIIALGPAANWAPKSWDIANFTELAHQLLRDHGLFPGSKLMIVAAPHERAQIQPLLDAIPADKIIDLIGQDLLTVAACLKKATFFVGNDSGLMHIAAAMGTPTLGLFGPSNDAIYGPWGAHTLVVRTPESLAELEARQPYPGADLPLLMGSLTVNRVLEGVAKLMASLS